jgi:glycosyltransferase involved in cell wall biosynthesis
MPLKELSDQGRKLSLVLTGSDHGNRPHVEAVAARLGLSTRVHFCGFVPYEDILAFYHQSRALAYVSFFGPENLPPLEAMALECPVILSDIPGVRALHGDGPVLVQPDDPGSIAQGIRLCARSSGRDRAAQQSQPRHRPRQQRASLSGLVPDIAGRLRTQTPLLAVSPQSKTAA